MAADPLWAPVPARVPVTQQLCNSTLSSLGQTQEYFQVLQEQTPMGGPHARGEVKATVESQGAIQLKEENYHLSLQLRKLHIDTPPWPAVKTQCTQNVWTDECSHRQDRPSFSSCRLQRGGGPYRGWARLESELSPQNSQCIQIHDYCNPGTWLQWIHPGGLVANVWETPGQIAGIPTTVPT